MAKTKTEKIASIEEQIAQLENQRKQLPQQQKEQERKDRTKRFCSAYGAFGKLLPDIIPLTATQGTETARTGQRRHHTQNHRHGTAEPRGEGAGEDGFTRAQGRIYTPHK